MAIAWNTMLYYAFLPAAGLVLGYCLGSIWQLGPKFSSAVQHFAAGVVFAAVALELIPKIDGGIAWYRVALSFSLGVLVMIGLDYWSNRMEQSGGRQVDGQQPWGLIFPVGVDLWIDGLLLGIAFLAGVQGGKLLTLALGFEVVFLGFTLAAVFQQRNLAWIRGILTAILLSLLIPLGTALGAFVMSKIAPMYMVEWIAFGVAALLFLVTEELLKEAHQRKDTPWITAIFFLGFLIILIIKDVL